MSEAMSRREIEDVLSSIRRLVAQEVPSLTPQDPPATQSAAADVPEPAVRVQQGTDAPVQDQPEIIAPLAPFEPEPPVQRTPKLVLGPALRVDDPEPPEMPEPGPQPEAQPSAPAALLFPSFAARHTLRPVASETAVSMPGPVPEPEPLPEPEQPDVDETLARLESLLTRAVPEAAPSRPQHDAASDPLIASDTVIDEAMLHSLVADIVRQELQGELGEKITRAIRKLVRAEVARELQSLKP